MRTLVHPELLRGAIQALELGLDLEQLRRFARRVRGIQLGVDGVGTEVRRMERHLGQVARSVLSILRGLGRVETLEVTRNRRALFQKSLLEMLELCRRQCHCSVPVRGGE